MFKLGLKGRLILLIALVCAVCILSISFISTTKSKTALLSLSKDQLQASSTLMKNEVEEYIRTSTSFTDRISKDRLIEGLFIAYEGAFYGGAFSTDKDQKIITNTYKSNDKLYGKRVKTLAKDFGLSNILLTSVNGQVVMSAANDSKYNFLGRSLTKGLLKSSALATCFNKALKSKGKEIFFADFQIYPSSNNVHSFLCEKAFAEFDHEDDGIYKGDTLGVIIAELSTEKILSITQQRSGMGETGQTYLIGPDKLLRSDFSINSSKFNLKNSIQKKIKIETNAVKLALQGKSGNLEDQGPNGTDVLTIYTPLKVYGSNWAFIAEKDLKEITAPIRSMILFITVASLVIFAVILFVGLIVARVISQPIISANDNLTIVSTDVSENSEKVKNYSSSLNDFSGELSSSIQETVTTMDELTQMVNKNLDNVEQSSKMSQKSQEIATQGIQTVKSMLSAMNDINDSNDSIANEMDDVNSKMVEIISVIEEIASKTTVINDIVFQTKLLSFNASVEAARAGEHGKGFSVVAEEVGNLATASGKASTEISEMLTGSVAKVQEIIDTTKVKMATATKGGREKVETGQEVAKECGTKLEEILNNVNLVNSTVSEVKLASNEQASGIQEVSKAMQRLDQVCADTQQISSDILGVSNVLEGGSEKLYGIVEDLGILISGEAPIHEDTQTQSKDIENTISTQKKAS